MGALEQVAAELAAGLGARRAFTIPSGAHALWAWVATPVPPDRTALGPLAARYPRIRVAVGRSAKGIGGFRRTHREAVKAQQTAAAAGSLGGLTLYEDVELIALLAADAEGMQAFVASELGTAMAAPGRRAAHLLDTALAFLRCNGNASATAQLLGIHRNTVRNRLIRTEELLGRALEVPNVRLELALALHAHSRRRR